MLWLSAPRFASGMIGFSAPPSATSVPVTGLSTLLSAFAVFLPGPRLSALLSASVLLLLPRLSVFLSAGMFWSFYIISLNQIQH